VNYVTNFFKKSKTFTEEFKHERLISTKIYPYPRCVIKPRNVLFGAGIIKLVFNEEKADKKYLCLLLNSSLIEYFCRKYLMNFSKLTMNLNTGILPNIPIKLLPTQKPFIILADYMLFLNATEERRTKEKELIEFVDRRIIDSLVYELYFKEKFKRDGIKTNLLELVELYLKDISNLNSDEEKLKTIKEVVEKIKNDKKIMEQIEKIKSHHWVRVVEGERK